MRKDMKYSGTEWIGYIPVNWEIKPLKQLLIERKETNNPVKTDFILSLTNDRGVIPYSSKGDIGNKSKEDITGYKLAYPNDIVLNSMNVIIGSVGLSDYFGAVSPVYYMLYQRDMQDSIRYFNYIFQTKVFQQSLKGYGNGILEIRMRIPMSKLNTVSMPYPSKEEQIRIVEYLDDRVPMISSIISKTKETIEEYRAYKQSVITKAVTKGINHDTEVKDSGIEWIGSIPKKFEVTKFRRIAKVASNLVNPSEYLDYNQVSPENIGKGSGELIGYKSVSESGVISDNHLFYEGQILYSKVRPKLNKVTIAPFDGLCSADMYPIETTINKKFLIYAMLSDSFLIQATINDNRVKMPKINKDELGDIKIICPPAENQKEIVEYLDKKCEEIDNLLINKQHLIDEMEKHKDSLIYECVTGKKEI